MAVEYYLYYFFYTYWANPAIIKLALLAIVVFSILFIISFSSMLKLRNSYIHKEKLKRKLLKKYDEVLVKILTEKKVYTEQEIEEEINCKVDKLEEREKRILTNIVLRIRYSAKQYNIQNYVQVVNYFKFPQYWEKKLTRDSILWRRRALHKLDDLDIEIQGSIISTLTYNRNEHLRKTARAYYMYFSKINPFTFFDEDFDGTFNGWDKVEVHRMLKRREDAGEKLPSFSQWIKGSRNSEFQFFLIQEIVYFNQRECLPYLMELAVSPNTNMQMHSIDALGAMKHKEAEDIITQDYLIQPLMIQRSVVRAVGNICSGKALPFLKEAYNSTTDHDSRLLVLEAIYNYNSEGRLLFEKMKKASEGFNKLLFEHVSNPLISRSLTKSVEQKEMTPVTSEVIR